MRRLTIAGLALATSVAFAPSVVAQTKTKTATMENNNAPQTFSGCLMTEPDYRRAHHLGAGWFGGAGLGDEYVLVDATMSPATASATSTTSSSGNSTSATQSATSAKCADQGMAF